MPRLRPALEHLSHAISGGGTRAGPAVHLPGPAHRDPGALRGILIRVEGRRGIRAGLAGLGLLSLAGYAVGLRWLFEPGALPLIRYVGLSAGLFVLYGLAACLVLRKPSGDRVAVGIILAFGLLFRLAVLPSPVVLSTDLYRYLWDGRVQLAGINPYRYPPAAPELAPLRDPVIHPEINRPAKRTIYPPGAQATFTLMAAIAPNSVVAWRLLLLASEVATALLLLVLLRGMAVPATAVLLYAWAPLAVFEGVQAGHVDFVMLPALLLALLWRQEGHMARAGAALGVAVLLKLYPAVLLPVWLRRADWRFPAACAAVVGAAYLPYAAGMGPGVLGFLPEYFGRVEDFNVGLRFFLTEGIGLRGDAERGIVMLVLFGILLAVLLRVGRGRSEDARGVFEAGLAAVGAYLILVPTAMHPWYAVWVLPFLTVRPSWAWLWFSGAVTLSYLTYNWAFPFWLRAVEFLPLYALLAWEWRRRGADARLSTAVVAIMAKTPQPGEVKTRLCPPLSTAQAAELYRCFLQDKIEQVRELKEATPAIAFTPADGRGVFEELAPDFVLVPQRGADLGARLANTFAELLKNGWAAVLAIDSDTPTLPAAFLEQAITLIRDPTVDLVLGPSEDGGYYLIGLRAPQRELFDGIAWSTPLVLPETIKRAESQGLRIARLPTWYDVDTPGDLERLRVELRRPEEIEPRHTRRFFMEHGG